MKEKRSTSAKEQSQPKNRLPKIDSWDAFDGRSMDDVPTTKMDNLELIHYKALHYFPYIF